MRLNNQEIVRQRSMIEKAKDGVDNVRKNLSLADR